MTPSSKMHQSQSSSLSSSQISLTCAFHPGNTITNFCCNASCLLPMCPVCVAIHSEQHREQKTHGQFQSIQQVINDISTFFVTVNKFLQELSQQYTEDYWNKQKLLQNCKQVLNTQKSKFIKQVERRFEEIQHKLTRKIYEFQDSVHDKYKQLQAEIQYLYDTINKQREDFTATNQRVLKNVICFYSQKKQEKMKQWQVKFRNDVNQLKKMSIKVNCNSQLFDLPKSIEYFFSVQNFDDENNEYLISSARQLIASDNTKRKRVDSPRWPPTSNNENEYTTRQYAPTNNQFTMDGEKSMINQLISPQQSFHIQKHQTQWSASKI